MLDALEFCVETVDAVLDAHEILAQMGKISSQGRELLFNRTQAQRKAPQQLDYLIELAVGATEALVHEFL